MKTQIAIVSTLLVLFLAACAPGAPALEDEITEPEQTEMLTATVDEQLPSPVPPTGTNPVVDPTLTATEAESISITPTPQPTLTVWEQVQQTIDSYRNRLERASDGYEGLTMALEQPEPNEAWCGGLNAAIGDFAYVNDEESAQALRDLQEAQGCN